MRYKPNMYQIKSLENARLTFLKALQYFGLGSDRPKLYEEKEDIYAIAPGDWDKVLSVVTGNNDIDEWKHLFKWLGWIQTSKNKLTTRRRFQGSKPIPVVGIDKDRYELLVRMDPVKKGG